MATVTIKRPDTAKKLLQSVLSFSSDMKMTSDENGSTIRLKIDVPDLMRIEFRSDVITSSEPVSVCIKDAMRMFRAIDLVVSERNGKNDPIEMRYDNGNGGMFLVFDEGSLQFKIGLVDEKSIMQCVDNAEFKQLSDNYSFKINVERIKALFRQSQIVRSTDAKVYIVNTSGQEIAAKLEDPAQLNSGMVSVKIADSILSGEFTPLCVKSDTFKSLIKLPFEEGTFRYTTLKAILFEADSVEDGFTVSTKAMFSPKKMSAR